MSQPAYYGANIAENSSGSGGGLNSKPSSLCSSNNHQEWHILSSIGLYVKTYPTNQSVRDCTTPYPQELIERHSQEDIGDFGLQDQPSL